MTIDAEKCIASVIQKNAGRPGPAYTEKVTIGHEVKRNVLAGKKDRINVVLFYSALDNNYFDNIDSKWI